MTNIEDRQWRFNIWLTGLWRRKSKQGITTNTKNSNLRKLSWINGYNKLSGFTVFHLIKGEISIHYIPPDEHTTTTIVKYPSLILLFSVFFFNLFTIYFIFMAVLGLRFCARASSSCGKRGPLFIAVHGPLTIAASLVAEHRLQTHRLSNCGSRAQLLHGMWDLPRPGLEPMSPALAGRFSTTAPPGKPVFSFYHTLSPEFRMPAVFF